MSLEMTESTAEKSDCLKTSQTGTTTESGIRTQKEVPNCKPQLLNTMDPADSVCNCGPCQRFWRGVLKNSYLAQLKEEGPLMPNTMGKVRRHQIQLAVGDRVTVQGKPGSVKFVDFVDDSVVAPVLRVGIRLDESVPEGHDGVYLGKRYFHCTDGHGIFARVTEVVPVQTAKRRPPVKGNTMFPSWTDVCLKRKEQEAQEKRKQEKERKASARRRYQLNAKNTTPLPSISPRENKAHQMRREMVCMGKMPVTYTEDPLDVAAKNQPQRPRRNRELLVASLSSSQVSEAAADSWERSLRRQWRQKYKDPEKVHRMQETLLRLCLAYQEGSKLKHVKVEHSEETGAFCRV